MFFASKNDNRIWAVDIENNLIELIYDTQNNQAFPNLRPGGVNSNFNQVDNVVVSPSGDVLVAEDGNNMRLAIMLNGQPSKLLMQITKGGSEICGPAFHPDGTRLYFSSQRGPSGINGTGTSGTTYEMLIPPAFRSLQKANAFSFPEPTDVAPAVTVTSEPVTVGGFFGKLTVSIELVNGAQFSIDDAAFTNLPSSIQAGQTLRVSHTSSATAGAASETIVTISSLSPLSRTSATFRTVTARLDTTLTVDPVPAVIVTQGLQLRLLVSPRATLRDSSSHLPLAGKTVSFKAGNTPLGTAVTNANGVATCQATLARTLAGLLSLGYTVAFAGDATYEPSSGSGGILGLKLF